MSMHEALEAELADFKDAPAVLTFQSGFTANTGVIPTVTGETDLIVSDALNHASIIDGMRLSKAPRKVYPHADVEALREILGEARETGRPGDGELYRSILVVTDGVFSMDGDIAPLPGIVEAAEAFGAAVWSTTPTPAASSAGDGRGSVDHFGLHGRVAIQVGTLSKAVGSLGGYVAGSRHCARSSPSAPGRSCSRRPTHPPSSVPAARRSGSCRKSPSSSERLWANTTLLQGRARPPRLRHRPSETPITPVMMGDPDTAGRFSDRLLDEGVFAQPVVFPTVAIDKSRLRTIVTAAHADDQLDTAAGRPSTASATNWADRRVRAPPRPRTRRARSAVSSRAPPPSWVTAVTCRSTPTSTPFSRPMPMSRSRPTPPWPSSGDRRARDHRPRRLRARHVPRTRSRRSPSANGTVREAAERWARAASPIRFGVEITYERRYEDEIREHLAPRHPHDYVIGSVHSAPARRSTRQRGGLRAGRPLPEIVAPYFDEIVAVRRSPGCSTRSATSTSSSATSCPT